MSTARDGSWIGGDRDGNPHVTSVLARQTMAIQSDHVLSALEVAYRQIGSTLTAGAQNTPPSAAVRRLLDGALAAHPELVDDIMVRLHTGNGN